MTREEYLNELKSSIMSLTTDEQAEAIQYYSDYFDEADDDEKVMHELGTPEELAKTIIEKFANALVDTKKAANLALIGAIREDILPNEQLGEFLISFLKAHYPDSLNARFGISEITDRITVLNQISERRKLVTSVGENDLMRAEALLLKEFKDGLLGKITLEWYES